MAMNNNQDKAHEGLPLNELHRLLLQRDQKIAALEKQAGELQQEQAELSARLAYLDEIKEENLRLFIGQKLALTSLNAYF